jgi:hypothetical protein
MTGIVICQTHKLYRGLKSLSSGVFYKFNSFPAKPGNFILQLQGTSFAITGIFSMQ